jgi:NTP pyrophosphatase (non-canonical NTP hydrolase)
MDLTPAGLGRRRSFLQAPSGPRRQRGAFAMSDQTTTVSELRQAMARFVSDRDWGQFHSPKNLAMALSVEAAELMEHFLWIDNDTSREQMRRPERLAPVADEIADVFGVCLALCNSLGLDLSDIFLNKMARNVLKYPVDKARGRYRIEE